MPWAAKIYAAGFNAHGQLNPLVKPANLDEFEQIAVLDEYEPRWDAAIPCALWSCTIIAGHKNRNLVHLGVSGAGNKEIIFDGMPERTDSLPVPDAPLRLEFFGDVSGVKGYMGPWSTDIYTLQPDGTFKHRSLISTEHYLSPKENPIIDIAIAGNERVCVATRHANDEFMPSIHVLANFSSLLDGSAPIYSQAFPFTSIVSLSASATSFTVLASMDARGQVLSFGDARYSALLGRTPSNESPASVPTKLSAIEGVRIEKIVAGNKLVAAIEDSEDPALYLWGHTFPEPFRKDESGLVQLLNAVNETGQVEDVQLVDCNDLHIRDVAVGEEHVAILTIDGEVWGLGSNEYGQLGLGKETKGTHGKWVKCFETTKKGKTVVELVAAPFATICVVAKDEAYVEEDDD
ncbi:MAG: hypothetical protein Q9218_002363 [Villophora microphyllina]